MDIKEKHLKYQTIKNKDGKLNWPEYNGILEF